MLEALHAGSMFFYVSLMTHIRRTVLLIRRTKWRISRAKGACTKDVRNSQSLVSPMTSDVIVRPTNKTGWRTLCAQGVLSVSCPERLVLHMPSQVLRFARSTNPGISRRCQGTRKFAASSWTCTRASMVCTYSTSTTIPSLEGYVATNIPSMESVPRAGKREWTDGLPIPRLS